MNVRSIFTLAALLCAAGAALFAADVPVKPGADAGEKMSLNIQGIDYTFVWCPAGEFVMGSPASETGRFASETPHRVTLTRGFWLLESEVTQAMWQNVMGTSVRDQCKKAGGKWVTAAGPEFPIYYITWDEAKAFCDKLSELSGCGITLPTEAEWEYACRAGSAGPFAGSGGLSEMGWFFENSESRAHEVKTKEPNAWGLYDMHGNVYEWCLDRYGDLDAAEAADPYAGEGGLTNVYRGGSWDSGERFCRSAFRMKYPAAHRLDLVGLRPCIVPESAE